MKISKNQLRKIIKEELYRVLQEVDPIGAGKEGPYARRPNKYGKFSGGKSPIDDPFNDWEDDKVTLGPGGPKFGGWKRPEPEPEEDESIWNRSAEYQLATEEAEKHHKEDEFIESIEKTSEIFNISENELIKILTKDQTDDIDQPNATQYSLKDLITTVGKGRDSYSSHGLFHDINSIIVDIRNNMPKPIEDGIRNYKTKWIQHQGGKPHEKEVQYITMMWLRVFYSIVNNVTIENIYA